MSLTTQEWEILWRETKELERIAEALRSTNAIRSVQIMNAVEVFKRKIQSVVGQLE